MAGAGQQPNRGGTPQRRRGVQTAYIDALLPNDPGAEKTNAGDHLCGNSGGTFVRELAGENNENSGPERDQRICPQAGQTLPPLPFETDDAAKQKGHEQIERVVLKCRSEES